MKKLGLLGIIGGAAILTAMPFSLQWSQKNVVLSLDGAEARIGPPPTATSIAGPQSSSAGISPRTLRKRWSGCIRLWVVLRL
jgi:hypothetical protein